MAVFEALIVALAPHRIFADGFAPKVVTVEFEEVEGVEEGTASIPPAPYQIEHGNAVIPRTRLLRHR